MKTVRVDAEMLLMEALQEVKAAPRNWMAQLYRLSALHDTNLIERTTTELTATFTRLYGDKNVFIFFCGDRDIVAIGNNIHDSVFHEITSYIVRRLPEDTMRMQTRPLSPTFDLSTDWGALHDICAEKGRALLARRTAAERRARTGDEAVLSLESRREMFAQGLEERARRIRPCVLAVEDDRVFQALMQETLGATVNFKSATTAADARSAYLATAPDIVFLDIGLPDASGRDLLSEILAIDPDAYVVMLSGNSYPDEIREAMARGAKGFIGKPISPARLLGYITQAPVGARHALSRITG